MELAMRFATSWEFFTWDALFSSASTNVARVVGLALFGLFMVHVAFRRVLSKRKIQAGLGFPVRRFWRHELPWAVANAMGGALVSVLIKGAMDAGIIQSGPTSPLRVMVEFAVYVVAYDFYFYWLHRALHVGVFYEWIHKIHHQATDPNPLSAFSMSPIEGMLQAAFVCIYALGLSVHVYSMAAVGLFGVLHGVMTHTGYEFFPAWWYRNPVTRWYMSPFFHDWHHQHYRCHYGGIFTLWDHIFGTERPGWMQQFDAMKQQHAAEARLETLPLQNR